MTVRDLMTKLLNYDLDTEVVFELTFDDGQSELLDVNDVLQLEPRPDHPEDLPLIILSEEVPKPELKFNLN